MNIVGFSSKKQAGKSSTFNYLLGMEMLRLGLVVNSFYIDDKGQLFISDLYGNKDFEGIFDPNRKNEAMKLFLAENVSPFIKQYSFADKLKEMCVDLFDFKEEWVWGTDEQKNTITHIKWEDIPSVITEKDSGWDLYNDIENIREEQLTKSIDYGIYDRIYLKQSGFMTAREFMQFFGSNIMRRIYGPIWINSTIKQIKKDQPNLAVIVDVRFPNEVDAIQKAGGKVIRLTRTPFSDDKHESEIALDKDRFDWNKFDHILDNEKMTVDDKNVAVQKLLEQWKFVDKLEYT